VPCDDIICNASNIYAHEIYSLLNEGITSMLGNNYKDYKLSLLKKVIMEIGPLFGYRRLVRSTGTSYIES
jgi:hypothetical protein